MQDIMIREADFKDTLKIIKLMNSLFEAEEGVQINENNQKKAIEMIIKNPLSSIIVAEKNNEILGICSVQPIISTALGGYTGLIEDFIVDKNHRHIGLGSKILEYITNWAKNKEFKRVQLLCDEKNIKAQKFYEKHSFKKSNWKYWQKLI
jgi:GNAT superfamily N-acetyltransferase